MLSRWFVLMNKFIKIILNCSLAFFKTNKFIQSNLLFKVKQFHFLDCIVIQGCAQALSYNQQINLEFLQVLLMLTHAYPIL